MLDTPTTYDDIRNAVNKLCLKFPGEYWRRIDRDKAYPAEFVNALTEAGWLAALIPEEYDGAKCTQWVRFYDMALKSKSNSICLV